jgi:hypothetical protein
MEMMTTVILPWDFLLIMTAAMNQIVLMGVVAGPAVQAPTNVEQGKEIVTLMPTVVAI